MSSERSGSEQVRGSGLEPAEKHADVIEAAVKLAKAMVPEDIVSEVERAEFIGAFAGMVAANVAKTREREAA